MSKKIFFSILFVIVFANFLFSQTKVSGIVVDKKNQPVSFASLVFKGSNEGVVSNEDGRFYMESKNNYNTLQISFIGYVSRDFELSKSVNYDLKIVLNEEQVIKEVIVFSGKTSKKTILL